MKDFKEHITELTLGIRFNRSFRIPDIAGEIVDNILSGDKSPFSSKYFLEVREGSGDSGREKILTNKKKEYLRINTDDVILKIKVDGNFDERFNWLRNKVFPYFENELFEAYGIKNICRIGIVFSHEIPNWQKLKKMFAPFVEDKAFEADDVNFSFSKRIPIKEALIKNNYNDYNNKIYSFRESKDICYIDLDCQHYYDPVVEALGDCKPGVVFDYAKDSLEKDFYEWLNKYEG